MNSDRFPPPRVTHWRGRAISELNRDELTECIDYLANRLDEFGPGARHITFSDQNGSYFSTQTPLAGSENADAYLRARNLTASGEHHNQEIDAAQHNLTSTENELGALWCATSERFLK